MKAYRVFALVALALLFGGGTLSGASAEEPTPPQQKSKAEADAARKAARARVARCKIHPEICRQQPPK
jgi:hypothetical protein